MIRPVAAVAAAILCATVTAVAQPSDEAAQAKALVERAKDELAANQAAKALADADAALTIDRTDSAAADVKARAQASIAGQGQQGLAEGSAASLNGEVRRYNDDIATRNAARAAAYQAGLAEYNQRRQSAAANFARARADYQAQIEAQEASRAADLAAWRAAVAACKNGDRSKCAKPAR